MKPVKQDDDFGCAVACVAFVLNTRYSNAIKFFRNGKKRAERIPNFYCRELVEILNNAGLNYQYKRFKPKIRKKIHKEKSIVFIRRSKKYRYGHYLVRFNNLWMDSWINLPNENIKAGFRKRLPGKAIYAILRIRN